ncbi:glycine/D-amino acid oxidase-like deaminating enzyme [Herbaspirillum sp. Sphag1AN]|uniref:NAD(P)/FAD-dependent oxidoreductase n=1 Tax=unclassified Herbaspirillum TaxID=2624150 RepID=UPI001615B5E8|nr:MULTISPECIES: FAD-binding oxidoreductase [unclassified Herbaspirillum]MBB3213858.1 glycine/D-amino acid oxidase-like deaminating enzyme [Herbaspirillum sp. Sphag1AN]MBB3247055.1 glycine/D-amino acid oxidase-like deaminating enzyme [Herbaspirillum sp. Sphag64]
MKLQSYWLDTAPSFDGAAITPLPTEVDVVVVGGGFTGLSAALRLRQQNRSVVVLEADRVIGEASGRNGGQCNGGLAHDFAALAAEIGRERARAMYQSYLDAVETVASIVAEQHIDCDFTRCGKLKLAAKPEHYGKLEQVYRELAAEIDPHLEMVPAQEMGSEINGPFFGGLLQKNSAQLHVGKFGVGLAHAAARLGAQIHEYTPLTGLRQIAGQAYEVQTSKGNIKASQVLLATGGCATGPLAYFRRRLIPVGSFIIVTEVLPQSLIDQLFPGGRNYVTSKNIGNYFRLTPDNRLLFGGRARFAMSNPRSDEKSGVILRAAMVAMFPALREVRIDYCWGGSVDMSADRLPRAGQHKGLFYALGYSGHGVQMSVHLGQQMANTLCGKPSLQPWENAWPPIPGHVGKPWFLPLVGAYYTLRDKLS